MNSKDLSRNAELILVILYAAKKINYEGQDGIVYNDKMHELWKKTSWLRKCSEEEFQSFKKEIMDNSEQCRRLLGVESN